MTASECSNLAESVLNAPSYISEIETDKPYTDVFKKEVSTGIYECQNGFDERYGRRAHSSDGKIGRYPTLVDFRNMFTVGTDYGKQRAMGIRAKWDAVFSNAIGGYPQGSVVRDSSGLKYLSCIENNQVPIPSTEEKSSAWKRAVAVPKFIGNKANIRNGSTTIAFIKLETELPTEPVTEKMRIASFMGSQLSSDMSGGTYDCSGMILFSTTVCWPYGDHGIRYRHRALIAEGFVDHDRSHQDEFSFSLKISPYPDLLTNELHENDFIELASGIRVEWDDGAYPVARQGEFRSPIKAIPIERDKMYYLYIEYVNGRMFPLDTKVSEIPSTIYLEVYPFTRAIELPSAK